MPRLNTFQRDYSRRLALARTYLAVGAFFSAAMVLRDLADAVARVGTWRNAELDKLVRETPEEPHEPQ